MFFKAWTRIFLNSSVILSVFVSSSEVEIGADGSVESTVVSDEIPLIFPGEMKAGRDGEDIWLSILGKVFDVTKGKFYHPRGGYDNFAGRDASPAFATGKFDENGMSEDILKLTPNQIQEVIQWREFYANHESYKFIGHLYGTYYNYDAEPTDTLLKVEGMVAIAKEYMKKENLYKSIYPRCNMRHKSDRSEYRCQNPKKVPRKMKSWTMDIGSRCACFTISDAQSMEKELELETYHNDCEFDANECIVYKYKII